MNFPSLACYHGKTPPEEKKEAVQVASLHPAANLNLPRRRNREIKFVDGNGVKFERGSLARGSGKAARKMDGR